MHPLFLHVGLAKTGTTYLQGLLAENRPALREAGFLYPFVRPEGMFHAAVEIRDDHARWGLDPELIAGTWEALLAKAEAYDGTAVISHEILAGATVDEIARAAEHLAGFDLHLVVTARDLARQLAAHWQEAVKNGQTFSFAEYTREVLHEEGAPDSHLWNEQDLIGVLDRWAPLVAADHVHLVTCPPRGASPDELWRRFAQATGIPFDAVDPAGAPRVNDSLGTAQVRLLREVNAALDGRLAQPSYAHVAKRLFAQRVLSGTPGRRAVTPVILRETVEAVTGSWVAAIEERGYVVHGDLADLSATEYDDLASPDDVTSEELAAVVPGAFAGLLQELVSLR